MKKQKQGDRKVLRVQGEMTIYRAGELAQQVLEPLRDKRAELSLDLSAVTEIDSSGLQILLMARKLAGAAGIALSIVNASECVREVIALCNLTQSFTADKGVAA